MLCNNVFLTCYFIGTFQRELNNNILLMIILKYANLFDINNYSFRSCE